MAAVLVQGVWADPTSTAAAHMFQPWAVLEQKAGNIKLARELFKCAVKADPSSKVSWQVSTARMVSLLHQEPLLLNLALFWCSRGFRNVCEPTLQQLSCINKEAEQAWQGLITSLSAQSAEASTCGALRISGALCDCHSLGISRALCHCQCLSVP